MAEREVDVAILGAGSAGMAAHAAATRQGVEALLIEGGEYGTTCARTGCMPSKLLLAAAECRHQVDQAGEFGLRVAGVEVDRQAVMARVHRLRDDFVGSVLKVIKRIPEARRVRAAAKFIAPGRLQAGDETIVARAIVIATGSRPFVPPPFADLGDRLLTSDDIFELEQLPESVAVVGAGVIGLELGQALHRLGVRVRLFDRGERLGPAGDPAIEALATGLFLASLPCETGVVPEVEAVEADGVRLAWSRAGGTRASERFEYVLVATGRRP
jgi:dihydrolipoamide dehydrogenase